MLKLLRGKKIPKWAIIAGSCFAALVLLVAVLTIYTYASDSIFSGITAGGVDLGGMSVEEATSALDKECGVRYADAKITLKVDDVYVRSVTAEELGAKFSSSDTARKAYGIGREGGYFSRIFTVLGTVFSSQEAELSMTFDEDALTSLYEDLAKYNVAPVDAEYTIEGDKLLIHPKSDGKKVNTETLADTLKKRFLGGDYSELVIEREVSPSVSIDMDKVYSEVHTEVADARLEKSEEGNKITPHVVGVDFNLELAKEKVSAAADEVVEIPLELTQPKILTKHLETNLFKHKLVEVETHFSPKKVSRTANVRLAAQYVNGTILNPGEEFSYNKVVGPRTAARGFKEAAIFAQGEVVDGIGGGICQVSSTIYMAAIKANMKITERKNHAFYVDYTPKGEDATVVYGSIDFRFVNTSEYPIKIVATSKNNYIRIALMGTEPDEERTVKLTKKTHSTTPYTTREKKTSELPAGERKVEQKGQPGISMTVYRNVYDKNGKLVESYLENNSNYKPMPEIVLVGTGPATPTVAPEETQPPTEAEETVAPEETQPPTEAEETTSEPSSSEAADTTVEAPPESEASDEPSSETLEPSSEAEAPVEEEKGQE